MDSRVDPLMMLQFSTNDMTAGRRFTAVPSGTNRRWLFPTDSRSHAVASLALYQPRRFRARFAHTALRLGASVGALCLAPRQIRADHQPWVEHWLSELTGNSDIRLALHIAYSVQSLRTVTVAAVSRDRIEAVARIALSGGGDEQVHREVEGLRMARALGTSAPPLLHYGTLDLGRMGTALAAVQGGVEGRSSSQYWSPSHDQFVVTLEYGTPRPVVESRLVRQLLEKVSTDLLLAPYEPALHEAMIALGDLHHCPVLNHRDFAPWNLLETSSGALTAIDWEFAEPDGLPCLDEFYFRLAAGVLLQGWTVANVTAYAMQWRSILDLPSELARAFLTVLLIERIAWRREQGLHLPDDLIAEGCRLALSMLSWAPTSSASTRYE